MDSTFTIISAIVVVLTVYTIIKVHSKITKKDLDCKKNMLTKDRITLNDIKSANLDKPLKDFYVMTAYNCCSVKEDWVDLCALSHCIKLGCRCLDFELYEYNSMIIVGTTSKSDGYTRDSYNYIELDKVLQEILDKGFSSKHTKIRNDPLILNFRIKSSSAEVYDSIAEIIQDSREKNPDRYLPFVLSHNVVSGEDANSAFDIAIQDCLKKIIITVSDCNFNTFKQSSLGEVVNMVGGRLITSNLTSCDTGAADANAAYELERLTNGGLKMIQLNNRNLLSEIGNVEYLKHLKDETDGTRTITATLSIPDDIPVNPNYCYHKKAKINFIGMSFREKIPRDYSLNPWVNLDSDHKADLLKYEEAGNLDNYMQWFYDNLTAFIHIDDDMHNLNPGDPNITSCDSIENIHLNPNTIVNTSDKIKTKVRRYWYNTVARNLF
mgnify:CR=1 FL=1|tara:strand:- start:13287 stop:14597 length:1311 start_codon:yes stop_codon:yes gene_type:complete